VGGPFVPLAVLRTDPAAALQLPGATLLGNGTSETETARVRGGYAPARIVHWHGTQAGTAEVFAFYDRELRAAGFTLTESVTVLLGTESDAWIWCKPSAAFRLAIVIQGEHDLTALLQGKAYSTLLLTLLTSRDNTPCAVSPASSTPSSQP
jgi:hypothetical protein